MKQRLSAVAVFFLVLAGLFAAQPASASTGSWQPYGSSFTVPSNWYCGTTDNGPELSAQSCIVRSGNYVQVVTIVKNRQPYQVVASVSQSMYNANDVRRTDGDCAASGLAANSFSVCFTNTVTSSILVSSSAVVSRAGGGYLVAQSPWA